MKFPRLLALLFGLAAGIANGTAGPLKSASVNQIVNEVRIVEPRKGARAAVLKETIADELGIRTGVQSRSELLFQDKTLTRLGAETFFSFQPGTRDLSLDRGTMLLQVPKGLGGARIRAAAITAAITGTTVMMEHLPAKHVKILVLEGSVRLTINGRRGETLLLTAGKMVILRPNARSIPDPVRIDLRKLIRTSSLIDPAAFRAGTTASIDPLPSLGLIEREIALQDTMIRDKTLLATNLVIPGSGTELMLASDEVLDALTQRTIPPGLLAANGPPKMALPGASLSRDIEGPLPAKGPAPLTAATATAEPLIDLTAGTVSAATDPLIAASAPVAAPLQPVLTAVPDPLLAVVAPITPVVDPLLAPAAPLLATVDPIITTSTDPLASALAPLVSATLPLTTALTDPLTGAVDPLVTAVTDPLTATVTPLVTATMPLVAAVTDPLTATVTPLVTAVDPLLSAAVDPLAATVTPLLAAVTPLVATATDPLAATVTPLVTAVEPVLAALTDPVVATVTPVVNAIDPLLATITAPLVTATAPLVTAIDPVLTALTDPLASATVPVTTALGPVVSATAPLIVAVDPVVAVADPVIATVAEPLVSATAPLTTALAPVVNPVAEPLVTAAAPITATVDPVIAAVTEPLAAVTAPLATAVDPVVSTVMPPLAAATAPLLTALTAPPTAGYEQIDATTLAGGQPLNRLGATGLLVLPPSAGGLVELRGPTLEISALKINGINLSGGAGGGLGLLQTGGNGGSLLAGSTAAPLPGAINVTAPILATTGANSLGVASGGTGGNVQLVSNGPVAVSGTTIKVSDSASGRASSAGGTITLESNSTGTAIRIENSAQILSLLASGAPGPGGVIKFNASAGNIEVANSTVRADRGTVTVTNGGNANYIALTNSTVRGDVVKIGALGPQGELRIGGGSITADTTLKLYAGGTDGTVRFVDNVTLGGASTKTIAGRTVTIDNGRTVTINGSTAARVFTDVPNYTGSGGNGSTSGRFGGQGATTQPFGGRPTF